MFHYHFCRRPRQNYESLVTLSLPNHPSSPTISYISFTHHILILNKCKSIEERLFYITESATRFWSVSILEHHIISDLFSNQGKLPNNFDKTLPKEIKPSALKIFQDEYLMNFMTPGEIEDERVLEEKIVSDIKHFIMTIGNGFSFIANQCRLDLAGEEFFIDLLFFNRPLRCLVAFELKRGKFKPEYAGQLNFYLNVLDKKVKLKDENLKRLLHFHCLPRQQSPLPFLLLPYQQDRQIHLARLTSIIRNGR
ncbi:MAG: hypothetical protein BGO55_32040 [Sphingobacteriales bacterium 50-39]|nr:MAG: hypothetical protein BGO55_32040 [Sphingobacteriales bacterium 50-39]